MSQQPTMLTPVASRTRGLQIVHGMRKMDSLGEKVSERSAVVNDEILCCLAMETAIVIPAECQAPLTLP
jgi:hypothetical protein